MRTSHAPPAGKAPSIEALAHSFKRAMAAARRLRGRDTHRPGALSHAQYQGLFELLRRGGVPGRDQFLSGLRGRGELPAGPLPAVADVSRASIPQMRDRLADAGLVERVRS